MSSRAWKVPLWHDSPKGQWIEGVIKVPSRLAHAEPHTNEKHAFDTLVLEQLARWSRWRELRGWTMATTPQVRGPYDPPTKTAADEMNPDEKWYFVIARFTRRKPVLISFEDAIHTMDKAIRKRC